MIMVDAIAALYRVRKVEKDMLDACVHLHYLVTDCPLPPHPLALGVHGTIQRARDLYETLGEKLAIPAEQVEAAYETTCYYLANHPEVPIVSTCGHHEACAAIIVDKVTEETREMVALALGKESEDQVYKALKMYAPAFRSADELKQLQAMFMKETLAVAAYTFKATPAATTSEGELDSANGRVAADPGQHGASGSANSANTLALFPEGRPDDSDLCDLVVELNIEAAKPKAERRSMNQTALDFFGETRDNWKDTKAKKYLAQLSTRRKRGKINLDWPTT